MRKKLFFSTLVLCVGFISCQDKIGIEDDGMVDVTLTNTPEGPGLKSMVVSGGTTEWASSDIVYVVDVDGVSRPFINTSPSGRTEAIFKGKLLANQGTQTYYAYHAALNSPCELNGTELTVTRKELAYDLDDDTKAFRKGEYCSMVAVPLVFDAQNPGSNGFSFYHASCLIEAHVQQNDALMNIEFDKVEFTMEAINAPTGYATYNDLNPFNTNIAIDMTAIISPPDVKIPFKDGSGKVGKISSTINYPGVAKFSERITPLKTYYDIPIYALPTKSLFACRLDVIFSKGGETVYHVRRDQKTEGIALAGFNDIDFDYEVHKVE